MDPGERRRASRPAARLTLLALAHLLALAALVLVLRSGDEPVTAGASSATAGVSRAFAPAPAVPPAATSGFAPAPRPDRARLRKEIETILANAVERARRLSEGRADARSVSIAVCVQGLESAATWVAIQADRSLTPASNMKLVTTTAALVLVGPAWQFETRFEALGPIAGGELAGDLVARAGGDPLYVEGGDGSLDPWAAELARQLAAAGVRRVRGALVLDEGPFLEPGPGPAWPPASQHWADYCALAAGFSANAGCLTATVHAAAPGAAARVALRPRSHGLEERVGVRTVAATRPLDVAVGATSRAVTVRGSIPASRAEWSASFAHPDPVALFGSALAGALARQGIEVRAGWRRERGAPAGAPVAVLRSPLAGALAPILLHSNNSVADQLFLALGAALEGRGDRAGGAAAVARGLAELGLDARGLEQVDGSGLSRDDRATARQLASLIAAVMRRGGEAAELFRAALPLAGESGGLAQRMQDSAARGRVRAKTGWISGASALSGIAEPDSGEPLAFSILVSYPAVSGLNTRCWKPMQDEICALLARGAPSEDGAGEDSDG